MKLGSSCRSVQRASRARRALALALLGIGVGSACSSAPQPAPPVAAAATPPLSFSFTTPDGTVVDAASLRGRPTLVYFITTYDVASQLASGIVADLVRSFTPRANALAVVLEDPQYEELLPAYRETLALPFPIAMADLATRNGDSAFGVVEGVPTFFVLDRAGRQVFRRDGPASPDELREALRRAAGPSPR